MSLVGALKVGWNGWNRGGQTPAAAVAAARRHWQQSQGPVPGPASRQVSVNSESIQPYEALTARRIELAHGAVSSQISGLQSRQPRYPQVHTGRALVQRGFRINAIVRSCSDMIAKSAVMARPVVQNLDGTPATSPVAGKISNLFRWPSGTTFSGARGTTGPLNGNDLFYRLYQDLTTYGNAMWEWVDGVGNADPVQLWRMDPLKTLIEPDPVRWIKRYVYEVDGERFTIPVDRVIHWRMWDPLDEFFGVPPLFSASRDLATDNEITNFSMTTIQNMGVPPLALQYNLKDIVDSGMPLDPSANPQLGVDIPELQNRWQSHYSGDQRGKPAVAWGFEIKLLGMDMSKLDVTGLQGVSLNRIAMVHGVPPALLGLSGTGSSGNPARAFYRQAREDFYTTTIKSFLQKVEDGLDARLVPAFDPTQSVQVRLDDSHIDVLREEKLKRAREAGEVFVRNLAKRNTLQRMAGMPIEGDDVFFSETEGQTKKSPGGELRPIPGGEDL